jgi:hypothetical protein
MDTVRAKTFHVVTESRQPKSSSTIGTRRLVIGRKTTVVRR